MSLDFKRLSEVPELEEIPDGGKVLVNDAGTIKQFAANGLGGGGYDAVIYVDMDEELDPVIASGSFPDCKAKALAHTGVNIVTLKKEDETITQHVIRAGQQWTYDIANDRFYLGYGEDFSFIFDADGVRFDD